MCSKFFQSGMFPNNVTFLYIVLQRTFSFLSKRLAGIGRLWRAVITWVPRLQLAAFFLTLDMGSCSPNEKLVKPQGFGVVQSEDKKKFKTRTFIYVPDAWCIFWGLLSPRSNCVFQTCDCRTLSCSVRHISWYFLRMCLELSRWQISSNFPKPPVMSADVPRLSVFFCTIRASIDMPWYACEVCYK